MALKKERRQIRVESEVLQIGGRVGGVIPPGMSVFSMAIASGSAKYRVKLAVIELEPKRTGSEDLQDMKRKARRRW